MAEKSEHVPVNSISVLQERALDLIGSRSDGVFQSDLRRLLCIDSSKCSKVVSRMQSSGLIYREKVPASSTYLIKLTSVYPAPTDASAASGTANPLWSHIDSDNNIDSCSHIDIDRYNHLDSHSHIDSYLTEIYLLYLVRGISG